MLKKSINKRYKILVISYSRSLFSEGILLPIYAIFVQQVGGDILDAARAMAIFGGRKEYVLSGYSTPRRSHNHAAKLSYTYSSDDMRSKLLAGRYCPVYV